MLVKNFEKLSKQKLPKKFNAITINIDEFDNVALALMLIGAKLDYLTSDGHILSSLLEQVDYERLDEKYLSKDISKKLVNILLYQNNEKKEIVRKLLKNYFEIHGELDENSLDTFSMDSVLEEEPVIIFSLLMKKRLPYLLALALEKQAYDKDDVESLKLNLLKFGYENIEKDIKFLLEK